MSLLYGTTQVMSESNGILDIQRRYFGEQTTVFFNETGLILNMVANNERFRESGTAINAVVTDKNIQIKPGNFMILQMKDEKSEEKK
jgi:hypothetical protein